MVLESFSPFLCHSKYSSCLLLASKYYYAMAVFALLFLCLSSSQIVFLQAMNDKPQNDD